MQRLLAFIEHNLHLILFVVLQMVCGFLIFGLNPYQQASFTHRASNVTAFVNTLTSDFVNYLNLKEQNIMLQDQVAFQFRELPSTTFLYLDDTLTVSDTTSRPVFDLVPVQVVYQTANKAENIFIINKGSKQGIKRNMGVLSSEGVAGIVLATNESYSTVMSLLNVNFSLTPNIKGVEYFLPIKWENKRTNILRIKGVNKLENISLGDVVKTGNSTVLFPPGLSIGKVVNIETTSTSQYSDIEIESATDFRKLQYAYVVINKDYNQIQELLEYAN